MIQAPPGSFPIAQVHCDGLNIRAVTFEVLKWKIMSTVDANLALGASEDFLNKAIRIGLYLSATFQVICLTTIIFLPTSFMKCFNNWDSKSKKNKFSIFVFNSGQ
uniref:Uncharacterized protein n=1 Tax=Phlebotomus papatasi TaxID=29031 RepID=A0A1B0D7G6_PHLPP